MYTIFLFVAYETWQREIPAGKPYHVFRENGRTRRRTRGGKKKRRIKRLQTSHLLKFSLLLQSSYWGARYLLPTFVRKFAKSGNSSKAPHPSQFSFLLQPSLTLLPFSPSFFRLVFSLSVCSYTIFLRSLKPQVKKLLALWGG